MEQCLTVSYLTFKEFVFVMKTQYPKQFSTSFSENDRGLQSQHGSSRLKMSGHLKVRKQLLNHWLPIFRNSHAKKPWVLQRQHSEMLRSGMPVSARRTIYRNSKSRIGSTFLKRYGRSFQRRLNHLKDGPFIRRMRKPLASVLQ